jgi:crotonobetainyl-CoA:carnitine CoA-transferase CaiB-like acyl-CoA transferase
MTETRPLQGTLVLDVTRMVPGAVLARMFLDLGARILKIEDPALGDPFRGSPPVESGSGTGAGFAAFYAGAQSVCLDLRTGGGAAALRALSRHADVLVESFRPGTMDGWDLGYERLAALNPYLVYCSISGYGTKGPNAGRIGHDLNLSAFSGLLDFFPGSGIPGVPLSDVSGGMLAASAILAALLGRHRSGRGCFIDQPLVVAANPFLSWALADAAAGGGGLGDTMLKGTCPAYGLYTCGDGRKVALCALEPKFWESFIEMLNMGDLAGVALDAGPAGREAVRRISEAMEAKPSAWWLEQAGKRGLPLSPVNSLREARGELWDSAESGRASGVLRPYLPSLGGGVPGPAPALGEHTDAVLREFGIER